MMSSISSKHSNKMTMKVSKSLREQVYQETKNDIITGVHGAGEKLSLDRLAEKYQVSKTPIREALNALQHEGLVEIMPRVGYFVSQMTIKDLQDIFELRLIIESASAEMAARNITDAEVTYLEDMHSSFVLGDIDSYWQYLKENREFHYRVALATQNKWLAGVVGRLLD